MTTFLILKDGAPYGVVILAHPEVADDDEVAVAVAEAQITSAATSWDPGSAWHAQVIEHFDPARDVGEWLARQGAQPKR